MTSADLTPDRATQVVGLDIIEDIVNKLRESYYKFIERKYSVEEFWSQLIFPSLKELSTDLQSRSLLGDNNIHSLDLLLINIGGKVEDFKREDDLGNKDTARIIANEIMATSSKIINRLSEICVSIKCDLTTATTTTNSTGSILSPSHTISTDISTVNTESSTQRKLQMIRLFKGEKRFFVGRQEYIDKIKEYFTIKGRSFICHWSRWIR